MHRRTFVVRTSQLGLALGILPNLGGCHTAEGNQDARFTAIRDRYFLRVLELNPVTATYLGGDGYAPSLARINGRLRDWRADSLEVERRFFQDIEGERGAIDPGALSPAARIDHAVLGAQVAFQLHQTGERRYQERSVDTYVAEPFRGVDWQIQGMAETGDPAERGTQDEWELVVERVRAVPAYLEAAQANLQLGVQHGNQPDHRMIEKDGVNGAKANAEYFRKTLPESAQGYLGSRSFAAAALAQVAEAGRAAADAWERFAGFLLQNYDPKDLTDRFAVGEQEYEWRVKHCLQVDRNVEDLYAYGAEQVSEYEGRLFEVAQQVARDAGLTLPFGSEGDRRRSTRAVMDYLMKDSPKDDDELFRWYRAVGERAVAYGRDQKLFDVPADYRLEVTPTPPVLRSTIDAAYYPAPPFKQSGVGRFYLSPTGNDPAALKLNNRASVADTAVHEGFPGHDWHYKYMTLHRDEISNIRWLTPGAVEDSSSMWEDSMAAEGWALYAEELMAEPVSGHPYGFYTAAERLYELQGQLLRAVRVRVDVGIHTGRMSFDDAVGYFTEHVSFYPGAPAAAARDPIARAITDGAERALYRYSKWPTQAITYNLGKNAIIELREALRQKQGAKFSARAFHERLMRMGTIPAGFYRDWFLAQTA